MILFILIALFIVFWLLIFWWMEETVKKIEDLEKRIRKLESK